MNAGVLDTDWTNGVVSIPKGTELRNRVDTSAKYTRSVKNGSITITVPANGKLKIAFASGSSSIGSAKYRLTKADGSVEEVTIDTADKVLKELELDAVAGTYKFEKAGGTAEVIE